MFTETEKARMIDRAREREGKIIGEDTYKDTLAKIMIEFISEY
jgi:hypothetical protein